MAAGEKSVLMLVGLVFIDAEFHVRDVPDGVQDKVTVGDWEAVAL